MLCFPVLLMVVMRRTVCVLHATCTAAQQPGRQRAAVQPPTNLALAHVEAVIDTQHLQQAAGAAQRSAEAGC